MTGAEAVRGVLLDVDGTLVASNDAHARSWAETLAEFGYRVPYAEVRRRIGEGGDKLVPQVTGLQAESDRARAIAARRWELFHDRYLPTLRPTRGAAALVKRLRAAELRLVVATSAREDEVRAILRQVGMGDLLPERTSSEDADPSKPDPDIVRAALGQGRLTPREALLMGDTPYDVSAGLRAGVGVVAFRTGGWEDGALLGAIAIYDDPAELLECWEESPFVNARARR